MAGNDGKPRSHAPSPSYRRRVGTLTRRNEKPLRRRPAATPPERRFSVISRHERCLSLSNQDRHEPAFAESPLEAPDRVLQGGFLLAGWNLRSDGEALHDEPTRPMPIPV